MGRDFRLPKNLQVCQIFSLLRRGMHVGWVDVMSELVLRLHAVVEAPEKEEAEEVLLLVE